MRTLRLTLLTLVGLAATTPWLGTSVAGTAHVHIQGFAFSPGSITIPVGDRVQWDNHDGAPHTVTDANCPRAGGPGPCAFDSNPNGGGLGLNGVFSHTFAETGTFDYLCTIHIFFGTLTVVAGGGADLVVDAVQVAPGESGTQKILTATVRNQGDADAGPSEASFSYLYKNAPHLIASRPVGSLAPGETASIATVWDMGLKAGGFPPPAPPGGRERGGWGERGDVGGGRVI